MTINEIRKEFYDYLVAEGFDVTKERHKKLKGFFLDYGKVTREEAMKIFIELRKKKVVKDNKKMGMYDIPSHVK